MNQTQRTSRTRQRPRRRGRRSGEGRTIYMATATTTAINAVADELGWSYSLTIEAVINFCLAENSHSPSKLATLLEAAAGEAAATE